MKFQLRDDDAERNIHKFFRHLHKLNKALLTKITLMAKGEKALSTKAIGRMISLFKKEPLVMAHNTGSSREETNPEAFSALTARSSPKIPAVFLVAILLIAATSSIIAAISSKSAKNPDPIYNHLV